MCSPVNNTASTSRPQAVAIIPARYSSTRFPGKPLVEILGRPMIIRVVERALSAQNIARAIVATDDRRILDAVRQAGFEAVMTSPAHRSGSDRLAEVAASLDDADVIVNVQGDEPLISPRTIELAVDELINADEALMVTTCEAITRASDVVSTDVVKVIVDRGGRALYFSRSPIPYPRDAVQQHGSLSAALENDPQLLKLFRKHTGLYAYRRSFLLEYAGWPQTELERTEALEQLRALERGVTIKVVETDEPSIGVDTVEDLERVRALLENKPSSESV
ncbi:MAG TPA: 3-deoxy-manno-octulosonate cytidylyltransferase [Pyrinomonadaceae bacterium]|nr:3-deoxy-manno-octulosonate cytidylyltransferase [Pyrinomonadaceae bacterium]